MQLPTPRFLTWYAAPTLVLLALATAPLIAGSGTLYRRDVLETHFPLKVAQAEALRQFEVPLVDPYRAGGQPLLGNPNVLALYPDNLLYLVASPLWALNAHFWIHLLLAPWAVFWLGRAWGLGPAAAWAAGVCYAVSGFMLSQLNMYNLVAGAALAPAFAAASLELWRRPVRRLAWAAAALLWALLLLAGEPFFALCALGLGLSAGIVRHRRAPEAPGRFAAALACGTALAAPQIVEFLRILPLSFRGSFGFAPLTVLKQSWDPRTVVEWVVPFFFGEPGLGFWGFRFYGGEAPFFYSFYPGLLALGLVATSLPWVRRAAAVWAWIAVGAGVFVALGEWNPVMRWFSALPAGGLFRFPVKAWLLVAVGAALLCGLGFERLLEGKGQQGLERLLVASGLLYLAAWALFGAGVFGGFEAERSRWGRLCLTSLGLATLLALAVRLLRRRPEAGGAVLVGLHAAGQLFFLSPLYHADDVAAYVTAPEILEHVPADAPVVHGGFGDLFRPRERAAPPPEASHASYMRRQVRELYPFAGVFWGRRYELNPSPEGLDSFFTSYLVDVMRQMDDAERLRLLAASGVGTLVLPRELEPSARPLAERVGGVTTGGHEAFVYRVRQPVAPARLVSTVLRAADPLAAVRILVSPSFDPRTEAVVAGAGGDVRFASPGRARILAETAESVDLDVEAPDGGFLVLRRSFLEIYRAEIDGEPARPVPVDVHRLGLEVPAGARRVRVWADRGPTRTAGAVAALGALGLLLGLVRRPRGAGRINP